MRALLRGWRTKEVRRKADELIEVFESAIKMIEDPSDFMCMSYGRKKEDFDGDLSGEMYDLGKLCESIQFSFDEYKVRPYDEEEEEA